MSDPANIVVFKQSLMGVIAYVYEQFPAPAVLETDRMTEDGLKWLAKAGILQGQVGGGLNDYILWDATLTPMALSILQMKEPHSGVPGETLGQLVIRTVKGADEREMSVVSDLLGQRLLSI